MKATLLDGFLALLTALSFTAQPAPADAFTQNQRLGQGVNIISYDPLWRSPDQARFKAEHIRLLKEEDFRSVRDNLHPFRHMDRERAWALRDTWFATLDSAVNEARAATMPVTSHRFACADYTQGKVFIVSAGGIVEWEHPAPSCDELWALPNGNLLFTTGHGVKEVTREKKVVFSYESKSEIYACQRLANGNTFIGECNAGRLLEVDPSGKVVKEIRLLPEGENGGHLYMRNARHLASGHYLVAHYGDQVVREYDGDGRKVREIPAASGPHSVVRLPNGHTLIACGDLVKDGARVFEVDADGRKVWEIASRDLPDITLKFMTGLQRLPNGNTVMSNWQGHGQFGSGPHVIEVTPDKKVVWTFANHQTMKTISSLQVLDVPGDATMGRVWH